MATQDHSEEEPNQRLARLRRGAILLGLFSFSLAFPQESLEAARREKKILSSDDLVIVDCLLPPRTRRLGRRSTYLSPRQPIKTTAVECRVRGGEYTNPDQANLGTALQVWLAPAKGGDAEAQFYVGQIFEKGLGVPPDFSSAAQWYRKAAEQGYSSAQINLGSLYETGRGVEKDPQVALSWYRKAAGLAEDLVVLQSSEYEALTQAQVVLERRSEELEALRQEIERLGSSQQESEAQERRLQMRVDDLARKSREVDSLREEVEALRSRAPEPARPAGRERPADPVGVSSLAKAGVSFGSYYALVIGNSNYESLAPIPAGEQDARRVAETLEKQYGFTVELKLDASRLSIMKALNDLRERLTPDDNLLLFYAGHAKRDARGTRTFWQPVDADPMNPVNWIPTELVSEHLDLIPARHVIVVADALFSGLRTRSSVAQLPRGMTDEERVHYLRALREKRCRLVLTSGALSSGERSFSEAFVRVLKENSGVLEASQVYRELVRKQPANAGGQALEFASMRWARNEVADFFFVRSGK